MVFIGVNSLNEGVERDPASTLAMLDLLTELLKINCRDYMH
jgi:hypothetical protein